VSTRSVETKRDSHSIEEALFSRTFFQSNADFDVFDADERRAPVPTQARMVKPPRGVGNEN
jgi:hypothetical protein